MGSCPPGWSYPARVPNTRGEGEGEAGRVALAVGKLPVRGGSLLLSTVGTWEGLLLMAVSELGWEIMSKVMALAEPATRSRAIAATPRLRFRFRRLVVEGGGMLGGGGGSVEEEEEGRIRRVVNGSLVLGAGREEVEGEESRLRGVLKPIMVCVFSRAMAVPLLELVG